MDFTSQPHSLLQEIFERPHLYRISPKRGQQAAVGRNGDAIDEVGMWDQHHRLPFTCQVPYANRSVLPAGHEAFGIAGESNRIDSAWIMTQECLLFSRRDSAVVSLVPRKFPYLNGRRSAFT